MCDSEKCRKKPDKLKGKPKDCTPEQIKECHGDARTHECVERAKKDGGAKQ